MDTIENYRKNGFLLVKNIFTQSEIQEFKDEILTFSKNNKMIQNAGGITIPDFIKYKDLRKTGEIKNHKQIHKVLREIFGGDNYRYCSHNDIGINRIVGWHKDKLNGTYSKYETVDIWSEYNGERHKIVKVLVYLQDHSKNNDALKIVPKSHLVKNIDTKSFIQLKPNIGDVLIFDQRITHRGMDKQVKGSRILVSFGFGKNNIFTDNFEKGTVARQNKQNNILLQV